MLVMASGSGGEPGTKRLSISRDAEVTSLRKAGLSRERIRHIAAAQTKARKIEPVITPIPC